MTTERVKKMNFIWCKKLQFKVILYYLWSMIRTYIIKTKRVIKFVVQRCQVGLVFVWFVFEYLSVD